MVGSAPGYLIGSAPAIAGPRSQGSELSLIGCNCCDTAREFCTLSLANAIDRFSVAGKRDF